MQSSRARPPRSLARLAASGGSPTACPDEARSRWYRVTVGRTVFGDMQSLRVQLHLEGRGVSIPTAFLRALEDVIAEVHAAAPQHRPSLNMVWNVILSVTSADAGSNALVGPLVQRVAAIVQRVNRSKSRRDRRARLFVILTDEGEGSSETYVAWLTAAAKAPAIARLKIRTAVEPLASVAKPALRKLLHASRGRFRLQNIPHARFEAFPMYRPPHL